MTRGQITRFEAGVFYKAWKNGKVNAYPEFTKMMYNECDLHIQFAGERYNQNRLFYDLINRMVEAIKEENYEEAQSSIDWIQNDLIERCGQKSIWHKYQNQ